MALFSISLLGQAWTFAGNQLTTSVSLTLADDEISRDLEIVVDERTVVDIEEMEEIAKGEPLEMDLAIEATPSAVAANVGPAEVDPIPSFVTEFNFASGYGFTALDL